MTKSDEKNTQKNYVITEQQRNEIVQYLVKKPFYESSKLINILGGLTEINDNISPNFIKK